jgi:hypothetical protein
MSNKKELFAIFDGTPAHTMIVVGLALSLLAPIIPRYKAASAASARAAYEQAGAFADLDMEAFRKEQEDARRVDAADDKLSPEDRAKHDEKRENDAKEKTAELDKKYDQIGRKRAWLEAQASVAGTRSHLVLNWLGRVLLLLGLLTLTFQADGTRQKIYLVVLLVTLFSSLAGVNLDLTAQGHMGDGPQSQELSPRDTHE